MRKKARKWLNRRTILFQMTIIISLIILPIYLVIAGYSYRTRESYVRQGMENVEHILKLYMQVLDDRLVAADEYMVKEMDTNLNAVQLKNASTEEEAGLSTYFFWQELYDRVRNSVEADAYFFWQTEIDSSQLASKKNWSTLRAMLLNQVKDVIREDTNYKWKIREMEGSKWLIHILPMTDDFICGSMVNLSDIETQILEELGEDQAVEVYFQEKSDQKDDQVLVASQKGGCYLVAEVSRKVFLRHMPARSKLLSFLLLVYVLAVPVLLYVVYIKMILPSRRINEAMRRLEENDRDFRISEAGENLEAYSYIASSWKSIGHAYLITIVVTVLGTFLSLCVTTGFAYSLSDSTLPGHRFLNFLCIFTMLFSGGIVASYYTWSQIFHIRNTLWALIFPGLLMNAFNVILVKNYFKFSVPSSLIEAARIDGAGEIKIFVQIVLPLSTPILSTIGLMTGLLYWNDWNNGLYYLSQREGSQYYTIQILLNQINENVQYLAKNASQMGISGVGTLPTTTVRMAIAMIGILPVLIIYPFLQKYFVKGITIGAVKE